MKTLFKKEILQDPESENNTYSNFTLKRDTIFCCETFKKYCKKFTVWNYEQGKFAIVDQITYEGHSVQSIDFCPFCGEKIDYEDENAPQKVKRKKVRAR
jgi:adenine-specific DNA methylase